MRNKVRFALMVGFAICQGAWNARAAAIPLQEKQQAPSAQQARLRAGEQGERVLGTVTSVGVDRLELRRMNGEPLTVLVNDQTQYRAGERQLALEDFKPNDRVFVGGHANEIKEFVAVTVRRVTEQEMSQFQGSRAFGEITAINGNELRVRNSRQGERVITLTDQTTIMRDDQRISLKDLKVGDHIAAMGHEADGKFIAGRVVAGQFHRGSARFNRPTQSENQ